MRSDWEDVKVETMRLTLLAKFREAHIVEESVHDTWWGAKPVGRDRLEGENVLGCLLVELRAGTVPAAAGPAFRLGAYEVRRVAMEIEQRRVEA